MQISDLRDEYPFTPKKYKLTQDVELSYLDEGEGEVVLLLHGNPTWSFYYRNVVKELSKTNRVIAIDNVGCGLSSKPIKYQYVLKQHIENVEVLLKALEIHKFSLVVHDWGGAIGMGIATSGHYSISKIAILNTAAFLSKKIPFRILICKTPFLGSFIIRALNGFAYPATFMAVKKPLSAKIKKGFLLPYDSFKSRIAVWSFVQDIPFFKSHPSFQTLQDIELKLTSLPAKIKIFWGGKDFCFNKSFLNRWRKIYPHAQVQYYQDAGHYLLEDAKDLVVDDVATFMRHGT